MNSIKIEKNIPVPQKAKKVSTRARYPFKELGIGDSFAISDVSEKQVRSVQQLASLYSGQLNRRFITRTTKDGKKTSIRVWRIRLNGVTK